MSVVVVGAAGWLGSAICRVLPDAVPVRGAAELDRALAQAGPAPVVVNAAGRKRGTRPELRRGNVDLVADLLNRCDWLVQLGSAAEYGLDAPAPVTEATPCRPTGDYGTTKHEGTRLALTSGRATVLRPFNVVDSPPQPGSPLADILWRIQAGVAEHREVEVLSGQTARDYVSRAFVAAAVARAVTLRPAGVFNLGSGLPVTVADIARETVAALGAQVGVRDLREFPASRIWCDPRAWAEVTGMREHLDARGVAGYLAAG